MICYTQHTISTHTLYITYRYCDQLKVLSKDKRINSRLRFNLEEILEMRSNNWQARRIQEGPVKIEEIHQKIALEEYEKLQHQQLIERQQHQQQQGGKYTGSGSVRDARPSTGSSRGPPTSGSYPPRGAPYGTQGGGDARQASRPYTDTRSGSGGGSGSTGGYQRQQGSNPSSNPGGPSFSHRQSPPSSSSGGGYNSNIDVKRIPSILSRPSPATTSDPRASPDSATSTITTPPASTTGHNSDSSIDKEQLSKRVRGLIIEYLSLKDVNEVKESLRELGLPSCGPFIIELIIHYLDIYNKTEARKLLTGLIPMLDDVLVPGQSFIEQSLREYDTLMLLQDSLTDITEVCWHILYVY